jgi:hypothetical protein
LGFLQVRGLGSQVAHRVEGQGEGQEQALNMGLDQGGPTRDEVPGPSEPAQEARDLAECLGSTEAQAAAAWRILRALDTIVALGPVAKRSFERGLWERDVALAAEAWEALDQIEQALREIRAAGAGEGQT